MPERLTPWMSKMRNTPFILNSNPVLRGTDSGHVLEVKDTTQTNFTCLLPCSRSQKMTYNVSYAWPLFCMELSCAAVSSGCTRKS